VLVLLYLVRLDRLLFGWAPHLAGLVVVVLMAARSDPWAWGLAAGLAVLGVGFVRLPRRAVVAVGAALVVVFGAGYGITHYRTQAQQQAAQRAQDDRESLNLSAVQPGYVVPFLASYLAAGDAGTVCPMLVAPSNAQFAAAMRAPDCPSAVRAFAARVSNVGAYRSVRLPASAVVRSGGTATVDGCQASWPSAGGDPFAPAAGGPPPGPALGRFQLTRYQDDRYLITGYTPCP
jgi:hypothetical protein